MAVGRKMAVTRWCRAVGRVCSEQAAEPRLALPSLCSALPSPHPAPELTQRGCHQLLLQPLHSQRHLLQGQVLSQDGAVDGQQCIMAGEAHGEDAEMSLQQGAVAQGEQHPAGLMEPASTEELPGPVCALSPVWDTALTSGERHCEPCVPAAWSQW